MKKKTRVGIIFVIAVMFITMVVPIQVSAVAERTYANLTNISYYDMDAIIYGKISAVKRSGSWYYKFAAKNKNVYISAKAFAGSASAPSTSGINDRFSKAVNSNGANQQATYVYNTKYRGTDKWVWKGKTISQPYYTWSISKYSLTESFGPYTVTTKCSCDGAVTLTYHSYIKNDNVYGPHAPKNSYDYMKALRRTSSNNLKKVPNFTVSVTNPGKNKTYLSTYKQIAKGYTTKKGTINAADSISLGYKTSQCAAGVVTHTYKGCASALLSGAKLIINASSKDVRKSYGWSDSKLISGYSDAKKKNIYTYTSSFNSPLYLKTSGDFFQVETKLKKSISYSKPKTTMRISFSLK